MPRTVSAIRFSPEEREWISAFARMNGETFSGQVRRWTLERLEDELDARDLVDAIAEDDGATIPWSEAKRRAGLGD